MADIPKIPSFVKWAGGKKQLLEQYQPFFPEEFARYIEPFVGGGAVLFFIEKTRQPKSSIVSDLNEELILTYNQIRDNLDELLAILREHKKRHSQQHYYTTRGLSSRKTKSLKINDEDLVDESKLSDTERAARFIYLNRTCFNGLHRVNKQGKFNVPMGKYKNPGIVREHALREIHELLQDVEAVVQDFEKTALEAQEGDFVYFDPPYDPLNKTSNFTDYAEGGFGKAEQERLANIFKELNQRGVKVMLSNSDTEFIKDLYKDFRIEIVSATRMINADSSKRGAINEVLVLNY